MKVFLCGELDYEHGLNQFVIVTRDEEEARNIALLHYKMLDPTIEEIRTDRKGYYKLYDDKIEFTSLEYHGD